MATGPWPCSGLARICSWTFWQYSSDGTVPGIAGRVDVDLYHFSSFAAVTY